MFCILYEQECILNNVDLSSRGGSPVNLSVLQLIMQPYVKVSPPGSLISTPPLTLTELQQFSLDKQTLVVSSGPASQADASELALAALRCFKPFLQDISIVYRVLDTLLTYLDKDSKWEKEMLAEVCRGCKFTSPSTSVLLTGIQFLPNDL